MNVEDVVEWANNSIFDKNGENLTPLQEAILTGVWQRQKYPQIAKDFNCSQSHVKKEAAKLWEKLREELGEDLNKFNFRSKLEKKYRVSQVAHWGDCLQIDNVICSQFIQNIKNEKTRSRSTPDTAQNNAPERIIDLTDAPELIDYYDRASEESTLKQWILEAHTRLITIYGLSGIGKSAIARKLIEEIQTQFDYIIWKSLSNTPTLSTLQTELKQTLAKSEPTPLPTILDYFRTYRCLIILDDLQNILKTGELAGEYLAEYQDYSQFIKQIATSSHQSCIILLSWEKLKQITTLEGENRPTRSLHLKGLGETAQEILKEKGLTDSEKWPELINLYQGHPTWLNIIASTIVELFDGRVSLFLADQEEIFIGDLKPILEYHLERLSKLEQQVISWLASQNEAVNISQPSGLREFSKSELTEAMQSLGRRSLVEKISEGGRGLFQLNPICQQYIKSRY
ncbi:MAG: hypothetical protein RLZZ338_2222 [Cyanobacteriota bacterium]|jgi:hypothetical protein